MFYRKNQNIYGLMFILPVVLYLVLFFIYPILDGIALSFYSTLPSSERVAFIGLENYREVFGAGSRGVAAIGRSLVYTLTSVVLHLLLGFVFALCLTQRFCGRKFARIVLLLPWVVSGFAVGLTFQWILNTEYGLVNDLLFRLGWIGEGIKFLADQKLSMFSVILATTWRGYPFVMIMLLAALQTVDQAQYESAMMDGVNAFQKFFYITLPNIKVVIMPTILLDFVWMIQYYDVIYGMTKGGPIESTETLPIYTYILGFKYFEFGKASAVGTVLFVFILIVSMVYVQIYKKSTGEGSLM